MNFFPEAKATTPPFPIPLSLLFPPPLYMLHSPPRRAAHLNLARGFGEGCKFPIKNHKHKQPAQRAYKYHKFWGDNPTDVPLQLLRTPPPPK